MKTAADRRGFTLLELLVVLVIVSVMSTLALPRLIGGLANTQLKASSNRILASLRHARNAAVSSRIAHQATFDFDAQQMRVAPVTDAETTDADDDGASIFAKEVPSDFLDPGADFSAGVDQTESGGAAPAEGDLEGGSAPDPRTVSITYALPGGVRLVRAETADEEIDSGLFSVVFSAAGSGTGADITIEGNRGRTLTVQVDALLGTVRLIRKTQKGL